MRTTLDRNIATLLRRRTEEERRAGPGERLATSISNFAGTMTFAGIHAAIFGFWIVANLGLLPGVPRWDGELVGLAAVASVEAIFISIFVLINQKRMSAADDKRADLNLQVSLLSEHETTRLIALVSAIAERLDVRTGVDGEIPGLKQDLSPDDVLDELETKQSEAGGQQGEGAEADHAR